MDSKISVLLLKSESVDGPDKWTELIESSSDSFIAKTITTLEFKSKNLDQLKEFLDNPKDGIIFTSPRSVAAVKEALGDDSLKNGWKLLDNYSVGESTSSLAKSLLNLETKGEISGNASQLADFILKDQKEKLHIKSFLYPCSNLKQDTLQSKLSEFKIGVNCVEVYETVPHPDLASKFEAEIKEKVDFLVYFSPSGVKFTIDTLKHYLSCNSCVKIIAIGPSTHKSLQDHNISTFKVCDKPTPESLLKVLLE